MRTGSNGDQTVYVEMHRSASWTRDGEKEKPGIRWKYSAGKGEVYNGDEKNWDETSKAEKWKIGEDGKNGDLWTPVERMSIMKIVGVKKDDFVTHKVEILRVKIMSEKKNDAEKSRMDRLRCE